MDMKSNPLVWLVLGAFVLAGIYWAVTKSPMATTPESPSQVLLEASPSPEPKNVVILQTQSGLEQSGTAVLSENADGKVVVTLMLSGGEFTAPQPAHIHVGTCPQPGSVKYPLNNVENGYSQTELAVSWNEMRNAGEKLAINVHKSVAEAKIYTACGDIDLSK